MGKDNLKGKIFHFKKRCINLAFFFIEKTFFRNLHDYRFVYPRQEILVSAHLRMNFTQFPFNRTTGLLPCSFVNQISASVTCSRALATVLSRFQRNFSKHTSPRTTQTRQTRQNTRVYTHRKLDGCAEIVSTGKQYGRAVTGVTIARVRGHFAAT